ncbi:hypothetical protein LJC27_07780, partial [Christensenellaceae bacterium OttesenSCG-928-M15]|nr:hypothetical protein [Christensenellaceae bacterium OttesenSCG-928-M15]
MKKTCIFLLLLLSIALVAVGCAGETPPVAQSVSPTPEGETEKPAASSAPDPAPSEEIDQEKLEAMLPVFSAIIDASGELAYATDTDFFWTAMYMLCVNDMQEHPNVELVDGIELKVPANAVREFAVALFADFSEIPPLPNRESGIAYFHDDDAYVMQMSDGGGMNAVIMNFARVDETTLAVSVSREYDDGETMLFEFTLIDNPYAASILDPLFYYSVVSVEEIG